MDAFTVLRGLAAPLPLANIDTDQIIPKQFLQTVSRTGLGQGLFYDFRYAITGDRISSFILNRSPWDRSAILIGGENFGCGSSREHAPWALLDFGIRCVIAPSFAEIFYNNCVANGILPVRLPATEVSILLEQCCFPTDLEVSLVDQTVRTPSGTRYGFSVEAAKREKLLAGLDHIDETLRHAANIDGFEARRAAELRIL
jgi:3-isopropylmalate/(R)-2-methylmalate dehydratase small subunit